MEHVLLGEEEDLFFETVPEMEQVWLGERRFICNTVPEKTNVRLGGAEGFIICETVPEMEYVWLR